MSDAILEAAARALQDSGDEAMRAVDAQFYAAVVLAAVRPLIEDAYARKLDAAEEIIRKGNAYVKGWKLSEDDGSVTTLGEDPANAALELTNEDVLQNDLRDLLNALDMPSGAQPRSPHEVFRSALTRMKLIRADALEEAAKVAENQPSAPLKIGAPQTWMKQQIAAAIRALAGRPAAPT